MKDKFSKKYIIVALAAMMFLITGLFLFLNINREDNIKEGYVQGFAPTIATSNVQTNRYNVDAEPVFINGGAYIFQEEKKSNPLPSDLVWIANTVVGDVKMENLANNIPEKTNITAPIDLNNYPKPTKYTYVGKNVRDFNANIVNETFVKDKTNDGKNSINFRHATSYGWRNATAKSVGGSKIHATYEIGEGYDNEGLTAFYTFKNGTKKYNTVYLTPFDVRWSGYVDESKEIRATANFETSVGKTHNLKAEVRTKTGKGAWSVYYDKTTVTSETTWKSDNPSVVSIDNQGKITALKKGTATIHVNWKSSDGDYHITTKTVVTVKDAPTLDITGNADMCFDKGKTELKAFYNSGQSINITNLPATKWISNDTSIATVDKGIVTFKKVGEVTITVQYQNETAKTTVKINDCSVPVVPNPVVPDNQPPTVDIITKNEIIVGNNVCIKADAVDSDGYITLYAWDIPSFVLTNEDTNTSTVCGYFSEIGEQEITSTVYDNGDENGNNVKDGSDYETVKVVTAPPQAYVQVGGTLKENRKITLTPQHAYGGNDTMLAIAPITKQTLTVEAVDTNNASKLKIVQNITGNVTHEQLVEVLAKFTGKVKITRYVENNKGQSDSFETIIDIAPDLKPVTAVNAAETVYRDTYPDGSVYATIYATMDSHSLDSDVIQKNIFKYKYDQNNNGSFDDENWQTFYDGQNNATTLTTDKVGKYLICGQAWEGFGQETINQFVNLTFNENVTDLRFTDDTSCVTVEVKNLAPTVSFDLMEEKEVELYFHLDDSGLSKTEIETAINNYVKPALAAENVKINYSIEDTKYHKGNTLLRIYKKEGYFDCSQYYDWDAGEWVDYDCGTKYKDVTELLDIKKGKVIPIPQGVNADNMSIDYDNNIYFTDGTNLKRWNYKTNTIDILDTARPYFSQQNGVVLTQKWYSYGKTFTSPDKKIYFEEFERIQMWTENNTYTNIKMYDPVTQKVTTVQTTVGHVYHRDGVFNGYRGVEQVLNGNAFVINQAEGGYYPTNITGAFNGRQYSVSGFSQPIFGTPTFKNNQFKQVVQTQATNIPFATFNMDLSGALFTNNSGVGLANPIPIQLNEDGSYAVKLGNELYVVKGTNLESSPKNRFSTNGEILTVIGNDIYFIDKSSGTKVKKFNVKTNSYEELATLANEYYAHINKTPIIYDLNNLSATIEDVEWKTDDKTNKFFVNLSKNAIRGGNEVNNIVNELDKKNVDFISIDTNNTKSIAEAILNEMDLESTQITVDSITNKEAAMTSLADHILAVLNDERVEVQVDAIGDSKATIRNELKKMNDILREHNVFANVTVKRNTSNGDVQFTPSKTTIALKKTTSSIDTAYTDAAKKSLAYGVIASNLNSNTVNNALNKIGKGKAINSTNWNTIQQNLAEYILNIVQGKTLEVHIYANGKYDLATIQNIANQQLADKLAETSLEVERILVKPLNSSFNYTDYNFGGKQRFVIALTDNYTNDFKTHFKAGNLITNAHFIGISDNQSAKNAANEIIQASMKKGTVIDYNSLQDAFGSVGDYITDYLLNNQGLKERYITKSKLGDLQVSYLDHESDPKINEVWRFNQELTYFENEEGYTANVNKDLSGANITFDKVGKYLPTYKAQDDPTLKIPSNLRQNFDDYKMWSEPIDDLILYVHREPSPEFEIQVNKDTGAFKVTSKAYDLDKESIDIGFGKGLQTQQWSYRELGGTEWKTGLPNVISQTPIEIKNTVVDLQGHLKESIKVATRNEMPPVAEFETDKLLYEEGEVVQITNKSYDPNGDDLTAKWFVKKAGADDGAYKEFATGAYTKGKGNTGWHPFLENLTCADITKPCPYSIKLVVTDSTGKTDMVVKEIEVQKKKEVLDLSIKEIEIFTAPAAEGLPVYMTLNETVLVNNADSVEEARSTLIQIEVYRDGQLHQTETASVQTLLDGYKFSINPQNGILRKDSQYQFDFVISSPFSDKLVIAEGLQRLDLIARTAEEKTIVVNNEQYEYKGLLSVKRSIGESQVNVFETLTLHSDKLAPTVTGLGNKIDLSLAYKLPVNQHYTLSTLTVPASDLTYRADLIDSYFDGATIDGGYASLQSETTVNTTTQSNSEDILITTLSHPKVYVEEKTGHLFSEAQVRNVDGRIQYNLLDGGHKLYTPIWLDRIGDYKIHHETNELGVNKVSFIVNRTLKLEGYMFLHINSDTKHKDKWLLEPVIKKNPFPDGLPTGWTENDVEWLKN